MKKYRIVIADDSIFMRKQIRRFLENESDFEVVGLAATGREAIDVVSKEKPDLLLLDIEMPQINGLVVLTYLMKHAPLPIIIVSGYLDDSHTNALIALEEGAIDVISKPGGSLMTNVKTIQNELLTKVRAALGAHMEKVDRIWEKKDVPLMPLIEKGLPYMAICIGSSSGGIVGLESILPQFPKNFPCSIFVAQHLPKYFTAGLSERLDMICDLKVCEAIDGQKVLPGVIYIAPGGSHMRIEWVPTRGALTRGAENEIKILLESQESLKERYHFVPSVDCLMESVASVFKDKTIGIILSGMGNDGVAGLKAIQESGGFCIAEDSSTAVIDGMPKAARGSGYTHETVPLFLMPEAVISYVHKKAKKRLEAMRQRKKEAA